MTAMVTGRRWRIRAVDVDAADEGEAPVALGHGAEPVEVAGPDRVIEAVLGAEGGLDGGGDVRVVGEFREGIPGGEGQEGEQDDADAEQAGDGQQDAAQEVGAGQALSLHVEVREVPDVAVEATQLGL